MSKVEAKLGLSHTCKAVSTNGNLDDRQGFKKVRPEARLHAEYSIITHHPLA